MKNKKENLNIPKANLTALALELAAVNEPLTPISFPVTCSLGSGKSKALMIAKILKRAWRSL